MPSEKPDWWDGLEDGSREDAVVSQDTERHYLRANGKRYWFDVQEITWNKKNEFASNALVIGEESTDLQIDQYYLDVLEHMIEDMSVDGKNVRTFLIGVGPELGSQLEDIAPKPGQGISDREEGNSDELFEDTIEDENQTQA